MTTLNSSLSAARCMSLRFISPSLKVECIGATRCQGLQEYHRFLSMAIQAIGAALMLLRTYALYGRDRRVLALLLLIIVVGAVSSIVRSLYLNVE